MAKGSEINELQSVLRKVVFVFYICRPLLPVDSSINVFHCLKQERGHDVSTVAWESAIKTTEGLVVLYDKNWNDRASRI